MPPEGQAGADRTPPASIAALLAGLEDLSRAHPDRVLRLIGTLPGAALASDEAPAPGSPPRPLVPEPFELLIFRGFSSLTTHPTAFDPDRPALPEEALIAGAELLLAPLDPTDPVRLSGPVAAAAFLVAARWRQGA